MPARYRYNAAEIVLIIRTIGDSGQGMSAILGAFLTK
jgi:hypothetical protein